MSEPAGATSDEHVNLSRDNASLLGQVKAMQRALDEASQENKRLNALLIAVGVLASAGTSADTSR